jgi:hypothetical protein
MTWRRATAILVAAWLTIAVGISLRDFRDSPPPATRGEAGFDAGRLLAGITGSHCVGRCGVDVLGQSARHTWRVRLRTGTWQRCFDLDPTAFGYSAARGFTGVSATRCRI